MNRTLLKKASVIVLLFALLASSMVPVHQVKATRSDVQAKLFSFITDVIGIDLTKYNITQNGYADTYPLYYGGQVEEESAATHFLNVNGSKFSADPVFFDNGFLTACDFTNQGPISYIIPPSPKLLDQAKDITQNYKTYVSNTYAINNSYIQTAQDMLSKVTELSPSYTAVSGNMTLQINQSTEPNVPIIQTSFQWIYLKNDTQVPNKSLRIDFYNNTVRFSDTYELFKVSDVNGISQNEAVSLGFAAAKNYKMSVAPDWSNTTYDMFYGWALGDSWMASVHGPISQGGYYVSKTTRDALTLYPIWQFVFFFNQNIGETVGIQVMLWGDTGEISYCDEFGYLTGPLSSPGRGAYVLSSSSSNQSVSSPTTSPQISSPANTTPTPTVPEFPLFVLPLFLSVLSATALLAMKKRKAALG